MPGATGIGAPGAVEKKVTNPVRGEKLAVTGPPARAAPGNLRRAEGHSWSMTPNTADRWTISLLLALALATVPRPAGAASEPAPPPDLVERAYERFRGLVGHWRGESTAGWASSTEYRLFGRGTAVLGLSSFDDAPPERDMATAVNRDGDRLLLTHYCEAGNQPRLVASRISEDAREVEFVFLDGTGMASRDEGHMDRAVFRFLGRDRFTSRWTWYQAGEETWMEEIEYHREGGAGPAGPAPPAREDSR